MRDKYNLNLQQSHGEDAEYEDLDTTPVIPGFGENTDDSEVAEAKANAIPGFGFQPEARREHDDQHGQAHRKVPFSKPVPKQFQEQWSDAGRVERKPPPQGRNNEFVSDFNRVPPPPAGSFMDMTVKQADFPPQRLDQPPPPFGQTQPLHVVAAFRRAEAMSNRNSPTMIMQDIPPGRDRDERMMTAARDEDMRRFMESRNNPAERQLPDEAFLHQQQQRQQPSRFGPNQQQQAPQEQEQWRREEDVARWQHEEWLRRQAELQAQQLQAQQQQSQFDRGNGAFSHGNEQQFGRDADLRKRQWRDGPGFDQQQPQENFDQQQQPPPPGHWNRPQNGENREFNRRY